MTRERLKEEVLEIMELTEDYCRFLEGIESDAKRLINIITNQDIYIDKLERELAYWKRDPAQARLETMIEKKG